MAPFAARTEGGPVRGLAVTSGSEAAAGARRTSRLVIAADAQLRGRFGGRAARLPLLSSGL